MTQGVGSYRSQEESQENPGEEPENSTEEAEVVFRRLSLLKRTRRSLTADVNYLDKSGQLLDRSLAKQEQVRQIELDSLLPNSVSVIVRSSTPEPDQPCDEIFFPHDHPPPLIPTPHGIPEDRSIPLRHLLNSLNPQNLSDCHPLPHQGGGGAVARHPPALGLLSLSAPQVPKP